MVVAGEASADLHAGHLLERLNKKIPLQLIGIGGNHLKKLGLKPLRTPSEMAVVGLSEAVKKIPQTLRLLAELKTLAEKEKPDFALLLDLPDFNLRLAPKLKKLGIPVIYYISPQVWAWRKNRVYAMAESLDLLLSILPFEKSWYEKNAPAKLQVEYVGHPVLEEIPDLPYHPHPNHIVIMPGSRESEWRGLCGTMLEAAALLHRAKPEYYFTLPLADSLRDSLVVKELLSLTGENHEALSSLGSSLKIVESPAHECLRSAKAAWIASGTATLEAGIVGTPMVVVYKVSGVTAFLFRYLVGYKGPIAMVNLILNGLGAEELVVPEILQEEVSAENLTSSMREILAEPKWSRLKDRLSETRSKLKGPGLPLDNAVSAILKFLEARR